MKILSAHKVLYISKFLNTIVVYQEYDLLIDIRCSGSMLQDVLVDGRVDVNVITIPTMRYIGIEIEKPSSITLIMVNKRTCKSQGMISNVCINVLRISVAMDFHVVLEGNGLYPTILGRPWLTKISIQNYWDERFITIGKKPHRQNILFVPSTWAPTLDKSDFDLLEVGSSESEEIIYGSLNDEVWLMQLK